MTPPTVNAYYNASMNDINFPAGVLLPPLYDPKMDDAPNYGNTGGTIGHELTHGFDDEGRQYDSAGNLRDWWTTDDAQNFEQRAQCIRNQYSQYIIVDDIKINGALTSGEDIADLGGELLAWMAWQEQTKARKLAEQDGLTSGATLLRRLRTMGLQQPDAGTTAPQRRHQSAFSTALSHQWRGLEHAAVRPGFSVQGGAGPGAAGERALQGVVARAQLTSRPMRPSDAAWKSALV